MTLDEILQDIHRMEEDLLIFERKYGVRTETFYAPISAAKNRMTTPGSWIGANGLGHMKSGFTARKNTARQLIFSCSRGW